MSYRLHTKCRACDSTELIPVFGLGLQPLANDFQKNGDVRRGFYPLKVLMCVRCTLSQLSVTVDPEILYRDYKYVTSQSETMKRHFNRLFCDLASESTNKSIVEIGSNDGTLLGFAHNTLGYFTLGIEPAKNLALIASEKHSTTIIDFFTPDSAERALGVIGDCPGIILARHCFAHIDDWKGAMKAFEVLAGKNTLIAIEVPYVHDLLSKAEFDSAYHEHLSYISITSIYYLLRSTPFDLHRVIKYGVHGGSLLIMLRHKDSGVPSHLSADEYLSEDAVTVHHWDRFSQAAGKKIEAMCQAIAGFVGKGKIVCGFGASAKATVWINACKFTKDQIRFVTDNSPLKPGRMIPGTDIPIISEELLLSEHPDVAVCFAWNYKSEILEKNKKWRERGGRFIFPTPDGVEIV